MASDMAKVMQYMLSHGCVTSTELFTFLTTVRPAERSQLSEENTARYIENVNGKIKIFNMMIRSAYDTKTRQRYYALISTVDNDITRKASHHTEKEFEYFRLIWQELQDGSGDLIDVYKIGRELKLSNYNELIQEWCKKYWLHLEEDVVTLGPRANLELDVLAKMLRPSTSSTAERSTSRIVEDDENGNSE